jgi:hypothetical protein
MRAGAERVQVRNWLLWLGLGLFACGGRTLDDGVYGVEGATDTTSCSFQGKTYSDGSLIAEVCICFCESGRIECEQGCSTPAGGAPSSGGASSGTGGTTVYGGSSSAGSASGGTLSSGGSSGASSGGSLSTGGISSAGATSTAGAATGGFGGSPVVTCRGTVVANGMQPLIDDMEDGDNRILPLEGRSGVWFTYNDDTAGVQFPLSANFTMQTVPSDASGGMRIANTYGKGFSSWGAGMGLVLNDGCPYDAKVYRGVRFYARSELGPTSIYAMVPTAATTPTSNGGTCIQATANACYDDYQVVIGIDADWREEYLQWGALSQLGWGTPAGFDPSTLMGMNFQTIYQGGEAFSFSIDDISFF